MYSVVGEVKIRAEWRCDGEAGGTLYRQWTDKLLLLLQGATFSFWRKHHCCCCESPGVSPHHCDRLQTKQSSAAEGPLNMAGTGLKADW